MQLIFKIESYTTNSGKQAITWKCVHCHCRFIDLGTFFYQSNLPKDDLEQSLTTFVDSINEKTTENIFNKKSTAKKLYSQLCNCNAKIIDFDYIRAVARAKDILKRGENQCK